MKKILIGLFIISLLVISGCNYQVDTIGGPSSLKGYLESDLPNMNPNDIFPPNAAMVNARVIGIPVNCSKSKLPEGVSNDCGIFNDYSVILEDTKEDYSKKFYPSLGEFPNSDLGLIREGYTCNFLFEGYKVKEVRACWDENENIVYEKTVELPSEPYYSAIITEEEAIKIAKENGLEKGIREYEVELNPYNGTWAWQVSSTLDKGGFGGTYYENGEMMIIHAYTGEIIENFTWDLTA